MTRSRTMTRQSRRKDVGRRAVQPFIFLIALVPVLGLMLLSCARPTEMVSESVMPEPLPEGAEIIDLPGAQVGGILIRAEASELATLNPLVAEDAASSSAIGLMLGGLTDYDWRSETVVPGLAASWEVSSDGRTFTFHLRRGLCWSDGHIFDADDVLFSYAAYMDERFPNRGRFQLMINGQFPTIEKIDQQTVRITTPEVYAPFLLFIGGMAILPEHKLRSAFEDGTLLKAWSIGTAKNRPSDIVGTGPFLLESYRPGERIVFVRNPHYYKADQFGNRLPYIDRIIARIFRDQASSTIALSRGLLDANSIIPTDLGWVRRSAGKFDFRIEDLGPSPSTNFVWFNQNPGRNANGKPFVEPHKLAWFQDPRFRRAVSHAVDRQGIIDGVLFGMGAPLVSLTSPANRKWFNPDVPVYPYDPVRARALLAEAGFTTDSAGKLHGPEGKPVRFMLETNKENSVRTDMATIFKENLAAIGIEVELRFVDFNSFVVKLTDSFEYEAGLLGFGGGAADPAAGKDIYMSGGRLHQWYPEQPKPATPWEAEIDQLMVQVSGTLDESERRRAFNRVQYLIAEYQPIIPLVTSNAFVGVKNKWRNIQPPPMGGLFWNIDCIWDQHAVPIIPVLQP